MFIIRCGAGRRIYWMPAYAGMTGKTRSGGKAVRSDPSLRGVIRGEVGDVLVVELYSERVHHLAAVRPPDLLVTGVYALTGYAPT